jgi:hypothetical protein
MKNLIREFSKAEYLLADNVYDFFWSNAIHGSDDGIKVEFDTKNLPNSAPPWANVFVAFTDKVKCDLRGAGRGYVYTQGGGVFLFSRNLNEAQEEDVVSLWEDCRVDRDSLFDNGVRWVTYAVPVIVWQRQIQLPLGYTVFHICEDGHLYTLPVGVNHDLLKKHDPRNGEEGARGFVYVGFLENRLIRKLSEVDPVYDYDAIYGEAEGWLNDLPTAALMSFSFIHCRNVELIDNKRTIGSSGRPKIKRNNKPSVIFKTLKIEPIKKILKEQGDIKNKGLGVAFHLCRGHFKDYRNGGGLFGKHKDIFWWDDQWRGKKSIGTILKDYIAPNRKG